MWGLLSLPTLGTQSPLSLVTKQLPSVWTSETQGNEHRVSCWILCFVTGDRTERGPVVSLPQVSVRLRWRMVRRGRASETQGPNLTLETHPLLYAVGFYLHGQRKYQVRFYDFGLFFSLCNEKSGNRILCHLEEM